MRLRTIRTPVMLLVAFVLGTIVTAGSGASASKGTVTIPHFKCYAIEQGATNPPQRVRLTDQFGQEKMGVGIAKWVCTPTQKQLLNAEPEPPVGPEDHLKCYQIQGQLIPPAVDLHNQLGSETNVLLRPARLLCVPTTKRLHQPG